MLANKRVRDLRRRSTRRLSSMTESGLLGTTTYPLAKKDKGGFQVRNWVRIDAAYRYGARIGGGRS